MVTYEFVVQDPSGIHARPAADLAHCASSQQSTVHLVYKDTFTDVTNVIALMNLHIQMGENVTFCIDGTDEIETLYKIKEILV